MVPSGSRGEDGSGLDTRFRGESSRRGADKLTTKRGRYQFVGRLQGGPLKT